MRHIKAPANACCYGYEALVYRLKETFSPATMDSNVHIEIIGLIKDSNFHVAKSIAEVNYYSVITLPD